MAATTSSSAAPQPVAIVCVGMAGSGKTTFMQRINSHLHSQRKAPYILNLDPAVHNVPFSTNIDIRDSVNYKEVMKQYNLGPNGGILTSLNLFATKIDQILGILEKRTKPSETPPPDLLAEQKGKDPAPLAQPPAIEHILVDTPGQIEVFVWSASGDILLNALASSFPTVIAYVIDTPRTHSTSTFMSNMLYACSILYKTKLPMILVFNKTDVQDAAFAKDWMTDFEAFQEALQKEEQKGIFGGDGGIGLGGSGYMSSLLNSMSLMLEEFYNNLSVVGLSSMTGAGVEDFFEAVKEKAEEFERDYRPELERRREERSKQKEEHREKELGKLMKDMAVGGEGSKKPKKETNAKDEPETISDLEDDDEEDQRYGNDDSDSDEAMDTGDRGLQARYQQAMEDQTNPADEDFSFARYVHRANMG